MKVYRHLHSLTVHIPYYYALYNLRDRNGESGEALWRKYKNVAANMGNHHAQYTFPKIIRTEERLAKEDFSGRSPSVRRIDSQITKATNNWAVKDIIFSQDLLSEDWMQQEMDDFRNFLTSRHPDISRFLGESDGKILICLSSSSKETIEGVSYNDSDLPAIPDRSPMVREISDCSSVSS